MLRMLLVGYCFGIRSERRLCEEVNLNLAYRWFCRLGLEDSVPAASFLVGNAAVSSPVSCRRHKIPHYVGSLSRANPAPVCDSP